MAEGPLDSKRAKPRFSFLQNAECTLRRNVGPRTLSLRIELAGFYIDILEPHSHSYEISPRRIAVAMA